MRSTLRRLLGHGRQLSTLAGLVVLCVLLWILTPFFLTRSNLLNVMEQTALNAIVAVGMTFVIVSGGIDLSVGSIVALSGVVLASALQANWPVSAAIAVGLLVGALTGLLNGLLITRGRLPPFIATLGLMSVARGAALVYTEGRPISGFGAGYRWLATGRVLDVPMPVILTALVYAAAWFVLTRTRFGRYVYAIGGNPDAAALAGINVRRTIMLTFALMGSLAAISAAVQTARLNAAVTNLGVQNELDVISAAVIGGTSFSGGIGTVPGAILGAVVMQSLRSGMVLLLVDSPTQDIVVGIVLVVAVGLDAVFRRRVS